MSNYREAMELLLKDTNETVHPPTVDEIMTNIPEDILLRDIVLTIHANNADIYECIDWPIIEWDSAGIEDYSRYSFTINVVISNHGEDQYAVRLRYNLGRIGIGGMVYPSRAEYIGYRINPNDAWDPRPWR